MQNVKTQLIAAVFILIILASTMQTQAQSCLNLFSAEKPTAPLISISGNPSEFPADVSQIGQRSTLAEYAAKAITQSAHVKLPKFTTPKDEIVAATTWTGTRGPDLLQRMLPQNMFFIDHQLVGANSDGLVKTNAGNMVHVRAFVNGIGTNMGISLGALKDNLSRSNKSVVREDADAVIVFVHGGGTRTTGHHVAASMMSYMGTRNYDVVSLDMPWHGEGPRVPISEARESLEILRNFIREFVTPSGKPVILVGHSMGGMISDMYMRMYPKDTLVSAVVPMSTVADPLPGGTTAQKLKVEAAIAARNLTNPNIPEAERDLGEWLARQNKLSPTCGMFCQVLMYGIDWQTPQHQGADFLPALYLIGQADGLYQGYEKSFADGVTALKNAQLKIFSPRRDIKDKTGATMVPIGHLIFDHKPPIEFSESLPEDVRISILNGTFKKTEWDTLTKQKDLTMDLLSYQKMKFDELKQAGLVKVEKGVEFEDLGTPETFVLLRNFIADIVGRPARKIQQETTPLEVVTQAWANNLVFRQFAKSYVFQYLRSTSKGAEIGKELAAATQKAQAVSKAVKADPNNEVLKNEKQLIDKKVEELTGILKAKGKVQDSDKSRYQALKKEYDEFNATTLITINNRRKSLRQDLVEAKSQLSLNEKFILAHLKRFTSTSLQKLNESAERAFALMMRQDMRVRELTDSYLSGGSKAPGHVASMDRLPSHIVKEFEKFDQLSQLYQKILVRLNQHIIESAQAGMIAAIKTEDAGLIEQVVEKAQIIKTTIERIKMIYAELEKSDKEFAQATSRLFQLEVAMANLVGKEYFVPEYYTIQQLLSGPEKVNLTQDQISSLLQKIWADWIKLWSTRIADSSDSLY